MASARVLQKTSTTTRKRSSKDEGREHLKTGSIVMVLYGESQWAKAKIHQHVSTGIKIQWVEDGAATQLIETEEVDVRIRAMNGEDKEENQKEMENVYSSSSSSIRVVGGGSYFADSLWGLFVEIMKHRLFHLKRGDGWTD